MQSITQWLFQLWQHPLIVLVVGTMVVWALENYYAALLNARGRWSLVTLAAVVVTMVILYQGIQALWRRYGPHPKLLLGAPPAPHAGLILLFSNNVTAAQAVNHHRSRLRYLCLIMTDEALPLGRSWEQAWQHKDASLQWLAHQPQPVWLGCAAASLQGSSNLEIWQVHRDRKPPDQHGQLLSLRQRQHDRV